MILVALGANLASAVGGPRVTLEAALAALEKRGVRVAGRSHWYRTPAFPIGSGPDFVNGAVRLEAGLAPGEILTLLHAVERGLGRDRRKRWAPRVCDLDLLAVGGAVLPDAAAVRSWMALAPEAQAEAVPPGLILPHPRLHERGFVLRPLADVAPDWVHPLLGASVREMLAALPPGELADVVALDAQG